VNQHQRLAANQLPHHAASQHLHHAVTLLPLTAAESVISAVSWHAIVHGRQLLAASQLQLPAATLLRHRAVATKQKFLL
jgi:hypothetical protein